MNQKITVIVAGVLAAAIGGYVYTMPDKLESGAKEVLRHSMIDPESMKFEVVTKRDKILCGKVNGKNRMGGYTGMTPFIYNSVLGDLGMQVYEDKADYNSIRNLKILMDTDGSWKPLLREVAGSCVFIDDWKKTCGDVHLVFSGEAAEICGKLKAGGEQFSSYVNDFSR